ncbi:MAG: hypothetical protein H0V70_06485 [Ktedonobacteraceae bacterium]|nr:hypothetical protein [Ktedonobacteraceae bacterium]
MINKMLLRAKYLYVPIITSQKSSSAEVERMDVRSTREQDEYTFRA